MTVNCGHWRGGACSRGQAELCWSDTGRCAQHNSRAGRQVKATPCVSLVCSKGIWGVGNTNSLPCRQGDFTAEPEHWGAARPIHTHTEHRQNGSCCESFRFPRSGNYKVWHYMVAGIVPADGQDSQSWYTATMYRMAVQHWCCKHTTMCISIPMLRNKWSKFSVNICSQWKLMGCLQKMSTKGHKHERNAFILTNSLNRKIHFYSRALSRGRGPECFWVLTLCHGYSPQHIDLKGLDAVCTDNPQPLAPSCWTSSAIGCFSCSTRAGNTFVLQSTHVHVPSCTTGF